MQRDPDFRVTSRRKLKFAGKNADDADAVGVQPDGTPYDVRVATETAYPGAITEDGDFWPFGDVFAGGEIAPKEGLDTESGEEIDRRLRAKNEFRFSRSVKREAVTAETGKGLEGFGLARPIEVIRIGAVPDSRARLRGLPFLEAQFRKRDQTVRLQVGERPDERGVHHGKNRRICADAERQREYSDEGESGILGERPESVTDIARQRFDETYAASLAVFLLDLLEAAELEARAARGLLAREAGAEVILDFPLHVKAQFGLHFRFDRGATK